MRKTIRILLGIAIVVVGAETSDSQTIPPASSGKELYRIRVGKQWGFIDQAGTVVISPSFLHAINFKNGRALVATFEHGKSRWGWIDTVGEFVIPPRYEGASDFTDGVAKVTEHRISIPQLLTGPGHGGYELSGYVDEKGDSLIEPQFDPAGEFSEGLAPVAQSAGSFIGMLKAKPNGNAYTYINKEGEAVITTEYSAHVFGCGEFHEGLALVEDIVRGRYGFIDKTGAMAIPFEFADARRFSEGLAIVEVPGKGYGMIGKSGQLVIEPKFTALRQFSEGLAAARIRSEEKEDASSAPEEDANAESDSDTKLNLASVAMKILDRYAQKSARAEKWGYIDKAGNTVVQFTFADALPFHEGVAPVASRRSDGVLYGFVDQTGQYVIEARFKLAYPFERGLALVLLEREPDRPIPTYIDPASPVFYDYEAAVETWAYIDRDGKIVWKGECETTGPLSPYFTAFE